MVERESTEESKRMRSRKAYDRTHPMTEKEMEDFEIARRLIKRSFGRILEKLAESRPDEQ